MGEKIDSLEETVQALRDELADYKITAKEKEDGLNETISSLGVQNSISSMFLRVPPVELLLPVLGYPCSLGEKIANLEEVVQALQSKAQQKEDDLNEIISSLHVQNSKSSAFVITLTRLSLINYGYSYSSGETIADRERTAQILHTELTDLRQHADSLTKILRVYQQKHQCETLYADGCIMAAAQLFFEIVRTASDSVKVDTIITDWISGEFRFYGSEVIVQFIPLVFTRQCIVALESVGDNASMVGNLDERLKAYSTALSFGPSTPNGLLFKWANTMLLRSSAQEVLDASKKVWFS